jgi:hypothetical protein
LIVALQTLFGGIIAGLSANVIGGTYPIVSTLAVTLAVAFILWVALSLRQLPSRAPIQRLTARLCLSAALISLILCLFVADAVLGWTILATVTLGIAGCLTRASKDVVYRRLTTAGLACAGTALCGIAVDIWALDRILSIALALIGMACILLALGLSIEASDIQDVGIGVGTLGVMGIGVAAMIGREPLIGAFAILFAIAGIGIVVSANSRRPAWGGVFLVILGIAALGFGLTAIDTPLWPWFIVFTCAAISLILLGIAIRFSLDTLRELGTIGLGVAISIAGAVSVTLQNSRLFGVSAVCVGLVLIGYEIIQLAGRYRWLHRFHLLLVDPTQKDEDEK